MAPFVLFQGHRFSFPDPHFLPPSVCLVAQRKSPYQPFFISDHSCLNRPCHHLPCRPPLAHIPPQPPAVTPFSTRPHFCPRLNSPHMASPFALFLLTPLGHTALRYLPPHIEYSERLSTPHVSLCNVLLLMLPAH